MKSPGVRIARTHSTDFQEDDVNPLLYTIIENMGAVFWHFPCHISSFVSYSQTVFRDFQGATAFFKML